MQVESRDVLAEVMVVGQAGAVVLVAAVVAGQAEGAALVAAALRGVGNEEIASVDRQKF